MKLRIKVLKGMECQVDLPESTTVFELKQEVEKSLQIPVAHQTILCCGRTLVDTKTLGSYKPGLRTGCKLTLVLKEPEALKDVMHKVFLQFYNAEHSERLTKALITDQEKRFQMLSLDDLERMAGFYLSRSGGEVAKGVAQLNEAK